MAVPFRRTSKMRKRTRRSHHALSVPAANVCPKCGANVLPHHICTSCGHYKTKKYI